MAGRLGVGPGRFNNQRFEAAHVTVRREVDLYRVDDSMRGVWYRLLTKLTGAKWPSEYGKSRIAGALAGHASVWGVNYSADELAILAKYDSEMFRKAGFDNVVFEGVK